MIVPLANVRRRFVRYVAQLRGNRSSRLVVGLLIVSASTGVLAGARDLAAASSAPLPCTASQVRIALTTNTPSAVVGQVVVVRATLTNTSTVTCTVTIGATSPTFTVYDRAGVARWSYCDSRVRPEVCPQYLRLVTLAPGHQFVKTASWATSKVAPVTPAGIYRLECRFVGTSIAASAHFYLARSPSSPRVMTEADAGRIVTLNVGREIELRFATSTYVWSTPRLSTTTVLTAVAGASPSTPTYVAASPGRVAVSTIGTPRCYPQCLMPSRIVRFVVRVLQPVPAGK